MRVSVRQTVSERLRSRGSAAIGILLVAAGLAFGTGAAVVSRSGDDATAPVSRGSLAEIDRESTATSSTPPADRPERTTEARRDGTRDGAAAQRDRQSERRRKAKALRARKRSQGVILAPTGLAIPSLGVIAPVLPVGLDDKGELDVPDPVDQVGWYRYGPAPGSAGSSVIAGHVDGRDQGPGALFRARELQPGQEIITTDANGKARRFSVAAVRQYPKGTLPPEVWSREGAPRLTLVTCGGDFANGHYRDNVVVYAVAV